MHGTRHSQNAGLGCHFPMDAHEGGVEPRKPGRSDCVSTLTSLGVRMNEGLYPASLPEWSGYISTTAGHPLQLAKMYNVLFKTR